MTKRKGGVSRSVRGLIGVPAPYNQPRQRGLVQDVSVRGVTQIQQYTDRVDKRRKIVENEMSNETRQIVEAIQQDVGIPPPPAPDMMDDSPPQAPGDDSWVDIDDHMEPESLAQAVEAAVIDPKWSRRYLRDARTWRHRLSRVQQNWAPLIERLVSAYLRWRYPSANATQPNNVEGEACEGSIPFSITTVNLYSMESSVTINLRDDQVATVALVEAGYLGSSPVDPSIAISLKTLELYQLIRQRKPSFSYEAFAKVLCDLYQVPYRRQWRTALADAFDVFLMIRRNIDAQIQAKLGRTSAHWRVLNACPPCMYELEGEKPLKYRMFFAIDGNDSTKRVDMGSFRQQGDMRIFESTYFVPSAEVDEWTLSQVQGRGPEVPTSDGNWDDDEEQPDESSNHNDVHEGEVSDCTRNWKAAQTDTKKRAMGIFDETGWFASGCRHGLILWVADMIQSGEQ
ncbi:hypothetical protein EST38_g13691 [Candolleomyces aberdarensis]|uniref:CxC1-like cysteine cluster associated with KDZ transposases domain-containing protein n=1 Tax=Candolleomyces aberdarensis TaxID=2316362 RepID=A0A4Q2D147_9AGAR|nr:hypothetical protein EST38_g13691 [Candolleomyces aberdarensis]